MARTLIHHPASVRAGEVFEVRVTIAHPMETGYRPGPEGGRLPRDILHRFSCRQAGEEVFSARLYPAISANPYVSFHMRARRSGPLEFRWEGDNGFVHTETRALEVIGA